MQQALRRNAINSELLKLELTESLVLDNINDTIAKMNALREIGVRFSLDDFGTGYSSFAFLEQHGCPACQGYLFSEPVPVESLYILWGRS